MTIASRSRPLPDDATTALPTPGPLGDDGGVALFLDFDGTLVEIACHPQDVVVSPELPAALEGLSRRLDGRLAIVSGRSLEMLDHFLGPLPIAMAGSHGGEFRPAGATQAQSLADPLPPAVSDALGTFARENGGLVFEAKPFSAAVHYRDHPHVDVALKDFAAALAEQHGLAVKHGKMVVELAMPGSDKGNAVRQFMELPPFSGARPLFVGDDVTDEDAFAAVRQFDGGGVLVGPMRPTRALWRLDDVAAVHRWLEYAA